MTFPVSIDQDNRWFLSLPLEVQLALTLTDSLLTDFASNVRMAEALNRICFKQAVEDEEQSPERFKIAIRANEVSARMKEQRLCMIDKYADKVELPTPANINFTVIETPKEMQIERLRTLGYYKEAHAVVAEEAVEALDR